MARWNLLSLLFLTWSSPALATTVLYFDMPTHLDASDAVVDAQVRGAEVRVDKATGRPWTFTTLQVDEVLAGDAPAEIVLQQPGGLGPDGRMHKVAGDAMLEDGEHVVLFLKHGPDAWSLTLWGWSAWHVEGEDLLSPVWRDQSGLTVVEPDPKGGLEPLDYTPDAYVDTLEDLRDAIRDAGGER